MGYKKEEKICECCGIKFTGIKTRKYCSQICSHEVRKRQKEIICQECGKLFIVQQYRDAKFCSQECKIKNQSSEVVLIKCENCGIDFERKSYKIGQHNFCCKECADKHNVGENHYEWKAYLHIDGRKDALRKWGRAVKLRDNYICQQCGETNKLILQAHHVQPKEFCRDLEFDENNGITLCIYCHLKAHEGNSRAQRLIQLYINNYESNITNINSDCESDDTEI